MRRSAIGAAPAVVAARVATLALAGPAAANPGDVSAGARYCVGAETFGGLGDYAGKSVSAADGTAVASYHYPAPWSWLPSAFTCPHERL